VTSKSNNQLKQLNNMTTKLFTPIILGIVLFLASCSSDDNNNLPNPGNAKAVTFVFPGLAKTGVVPYETKADPVIANQGESDLETMDIYLFDGTADNSKLERIYHSGVTDDDDYEFEIGSSGEDKTATLQIPFSDKQKGFFFVANGRNLLSLNKVKEGETTLGIFKNSLVDPVTPAKQLTTPLLMTDFQSIDLATETSKEIELARRVARFDFVNDAGKSSFNIQKILIFGTNSTARVFDSATDPLQYLPVNMNEIDFTQITAAPDAPNEGTTGSVFYIYPTMNDDGSLSTTTLSLIGETNKGVTQIYPVKFITYDDADPDTPINVQILANHRYTVQVENLGMADLEVTLEVLDWKPGEDIPQIIDVGTIKVVDDQGQVIPDNGLTIEATGGTIDLGVIATSKWYVDLNNNDWITSNDGTIPATEVGDAFTLTIAANSGESRTAIIYVRNKVEKSILQPLIIMQSGT